MKGCLMLSVVAGAIIAVALRVIAPVEASQTQPVGKASDRRVEDIYVARSMRVSRIATTTDFCAEARTGFADAAFDDHYTFHSPSVRGTDGLVVDANVATIGQLHACLGSQASPLYGFYVEGALGVITFTGRGECVAAKRDFPEPGLTVTRCFLDLSDLPDGYVGGQLTTNTLGSRQPIGDQTDPPGYTQNSIATIRLWKR